MPTSKLNPGDEAIIQQWIADGRATETTVKPSVFDLQHDVLDKIPRRAVNEQKSQKKPKKPKLIDTVFMPPATWLVGVRTESSQNYKSRQAEFGARHHQRLAVCRALGSNLRALVPYSEAFHAGKPIRIDLVRLAPASLDFRDNLRMALKIVVDSIALLLGANDKSELLVIGYDQQISDRLGVRIEFKD